MGAGAFIEPLVVVNLLFGGSYFNRNRKYRLTLRKRVSSSPSGSGYTSPVATDALLDDAEVGFESHASLLPSQESQYRKRQIRLLGWHKEVTSPNTRLYKDTFLSRILRKFPFLVEVWYWALIYWVYQLGRAATALTLVEGTVHTARRHALQVIRIEKALHMFYELPIQGWFLQRPTLMHWINRIYSFIHIPGTILFLVWLFYYTTATSPARVFRTLPQNRPRKSSTAAASRDSTKSDRDFFEEQDAHDANPALYEARRRTMATCNLIAFIVFTFWPCMPPRLLSDPNATGPLVDEARKYPFVDTVHGAEGESSVWTQNKFCNQYAAMPSLHFGYSLLIGVTIMTIPVLEHHQGHRRLRIPVLRRSLYLPSWRRLLCVTTGFLYPFTILVAIVATANHFILDAVAGSLVCALAWKGNQILLNLLPLEDWFLRVVRIHKPQKGAWWEDQEER